MHDPKHRKKLGKILSLFLAMCALLGVFAESASASYADDVFVSANGPYTHTPTRTGCNEGCSVPSGTYGYPTSIPYIGYYHYVVQSAHLVHASYTYSVPAGAYYQISGYCDAPAYIDHADFINDYSDTDVMRLSTRPPGSSGYLNFTYYHQSTQGIAMDAEVFIANPVEGNTHGCRVELSVFTK